MRARCIFVYYKSKLYIINCIIEPVKAGEERNKNMVPGNYSVYFMTLAGVSATLFGLIFVVISIAPESVITARAPMERQAKAATAYFALANPLIISLFALVPQQQIGYPVISVGITGFITTLSTALALQKNKTQWSSNFRSRAFILVGIVLYGVESYAALLILQQPSNTPAYILLANLLVVITIFGIARAWDLIGIHHFGIRDWFSSNNATHKNNEPGQQPADVTISNKKDRG